MAIHLSFYPVRLFPLFFVFRLKFHPQLSWRLNLNGLFQSEPFWENMALKCKSKTGNSFHRFGDILRSSYFPVSYSSRCGFIIVRCLGLRRSFVLFHQFECIYCYVWFNISPISSVLICEVISFIGKDFQKQKL